MISIVFFDCEGCVNFDIDCLRSFVVIADTMNFSRAADAVGRSQSTISQQIFKLETQVGKSLLVRRKGRVLELTVEGDRFARYARRILQVNDEAYASMREDELCGFLRLGVPLDFFGRDVTRWLALFKTRNPMVAIEVEADQSDCLIRKSARGEFDLAFFKQDAGATNGAAVVTEQLVWVCGPNYSPSAASLPMVLFPDGCAYRRFGLAALEEQRRAWHLSFVSPSFECLKSAIVEGLGVTVLAKALVQAPLRIIRQDAGRPRLPTVELAYACGQRSNSRTVSELTTFLADKLAGSMVTAAA